MKILLASSSSGSRGGGELFLVYLGEALSSRGHDITLWASADPAMDELAAAFDGIGDVVRSPYVNMYRRPGRSLETCLNFATSARIADEWRRHAPEIIHLNKQNLEDGLDLLRACRLSGCPSIATIHLTQTAVYLGAKFAGLRDIVARRSLRRYPGRYTVVQESRRDDLVTVLGDAGRVEVIHNGVPLIDESERVRLRESKREELGLDGNRTLVIGVGRLAPQKRPLLFIEVAGQILRVDPEALAIWIGSGELEEEWDRLVDEKGLTGKIRREPWQTSISPWLCAADVFLHVADYEGMPLALFEAMSARLPCVITPNLLDDMPFLQRDQVIVANGDSRWLDDVTRPERRQTPAANGRELVEQRFSHERMAQAYEQLYEQVIREAGAVRMK